MQVQSNITNTPLNTPQKGAVAKNTKIAQNEGISVAMQNPSFGTKVLDDNGLVSRQIKKLAGFSSAQQRLISGAVGIVTQPVIDWNNKNVDEETRKASCARIMGKIIAGTATGVAIRMLCTAASKNFTLNENILKEENESLARKNKPLKTIPKNFTKLQQCLLPEKMKNGATAKQIKSFRGTLGTCTAIFIMLFTNVLIDVPLTTLFTNKINAFFHRNTKPSDKNQIKGGQ